MMTRRLPPTLAPIALAVTLCLPAACSGPTQNANNASNADTSEPAQTTSHLERVTNLMVGTFSSAQQAAENPDFFPIDVRVAEIESWRGINGARWLYMEQAVENRAPYRQRVYRLTPLADGPGVASTVLWLPGDPTRFAGAATDPSRLSELTPDDLESRDCVVELRPTANESQWLYNGSTRGQGCPSDFGGAVRATSEVRLSEDGFTAWDRGFGPTDEQVWGPTTGPYRFDRISAPSRR